VGKIIPVVFFFKSTTVIFLRAIFLTGTILFYSFISFINHHLSSIIRTCPQSMFSSSVFSQKGHA
jgi:hypothetical protein